MDAIVRASMPLAHWVTRRSVERRLSRRMLRVCLEGHAWGVATMKRYLLGALLGGLVMFFWGFLAHTVLPLGEIGMGQPTDEKLLLTALQSGLPAQQGVYFLPWMDSAKMADEAAMAEYATAHQDQSLCIGDLPADRPRCDRHGRPAWSAVGWATRWLRAILVWRGRSPWVGTSMATRRSPWPRRSACSAWLGTPWALRQLVPLPARLRFGQPCAEQCIGWVLAAHGQFGWVDAALSVATGNAAGCGGASAALRRLRTRRR
jgi:hypothetical protein